MRIRLLRGLMAALATTATALAGPPALAAGAAPAAIAAATAPPAAQGASVKPVKATLKPTRKAAPRATPAPRQLEPQAEEIWRHHGVG